MKAEPTKLPWETHNSGNIDCIYAKDTIGADRRICEMIGPDATANAKLIVRAVNCHADLLAAVKMISDWYEDEGKSLSGSATLGQDDRTVRQLLRAAITKAEGATK